MATGGEGVGQGIRLLEVIKDLPLWLLTAFALALGLFLLVPQLSADLEKAHRPWVILAAILFALLALSKWISVLVQWLRARRVAAETRRTFRLTAVAHQCIWSSSKQADDSFVTQISADLTVKNRSQSPLGLTKARVVVPLLGERWLRGEMLQELILVRAVQGNVYGTARGSDHRIPAGMTLPTRVTIMLRGKPAQRPEEKIKLVLAITDEDENEQRIRIAFKGFSPPPPKPALPLEALFTIVDPIEKEVASVLQAELARYDKCGRSAGGLGSVHLVYRGRAMTGVGNDSWEANSPHNQSIAGDPEVAALQSDNLEALLAFNTRLSSPDEHGRLVAALVDRLGEGKGYLRVSYFIIYALWRLGHLSEALGTAKKALPQGEIKAFGMSNVLMLLNGLLRYRHPDFTAEMLDQVEGFVYGLSEHTFLIQEKIAAIRTARLRSGTPN
ncbi:hypothetical protein [Paracidovorax oryzae]|uniref:hypothetical protein n=1 Tax=Paracidovorax oryzae TaxID=862720 RepID=UPI0012ECAC8F|nr:hypothetical protein [Paracidovorax oryzae]